MNLNLRKLRILSVTVFLLFSCSSANQNISAEMSDFIKTFDGKYTGVTAAIEKYEAVPHLDTKDMDTKDLKEPKVTASRNENGEDCYLLVANDGIQDCSYWICWKDKKIVSIEEVVK